LTLHLSEERSTAMNRTVVGPKQEPIKDPLPGLKMRLEREYEHVPDERIDQVAKHSVERFSGARVREFVSVLAWRHARMHLRRAS
jgi:hypothetical protein